MARAKKDGISINYFINRKLKEKLDAYCEEVGQTRTIVIERALERTFREHEENKKKNTKKDK